MGQSFCIVNLTKKQYLHPHDFHEGRQLSEFTGTLELLSYLLSDSDGFVDHPLRGVWKGDAIQLSGDCSVEPFGAHENLCEALQCGEFERVSKTAEFFEFFRLVQNDG